MPVIIEFSRCISTYSSTKFELYISTIALETINSFALKQEEGMDLENKPKVNDVFQVFRMRWPIEVMFYQEKTF